VEKCLVSYLDIKYFVKDDWKYEEDLKREFKKNFMDVIDHVWVCVVHHSGAYDFRPMFEEIDGQILDRTMMKVTEQYKPNLDPRFKIGMRVE
jgi:hypothetical protein